MIKLGKGNESDLVLIKDEDSKKLSDVRERENPPSIRTNYFSFSADMRDDVCRK